MKTWPSHAQMVSECAKRASLIKSELTEKQTDLWHGATGVATEAGELLSTVKAHVIYQKPLDVDNVIEELGDLEFYMEQVRQCLDIGREETIAANMKKLGVRYAQGFSNQAAQARADKK